MPKDIQSSRQLTVGVLGGGQLARMMAEAGRELAIDVVVLAESVDDSATTVAARTIVGSPTDLAAVTQLADIVDVITLDHELVDLDVLDAISSRGTPVLPGSAAVAFAARKDLQRVAMSNAGVPVPRFAILASFDDAVFDQFAESLSYPPVIKAARGGYDGRGVIVPETNAEAREVTRSLLETTPVVLEERVEILGEFAALMVCGRDGSRKFWPLVRTIQSDGMCVEVQYPCGLDDATMADAHDVAGRAADVVAAVGVLAVELFLTTSGVLLNEVATRPHNSGHWTIEGSVTSQFENHLRAVLGLPLGSTAPSTAAAVMVNIVGTKTPSDLGAALSVEGAHIHDYGKSWRRGRKLGHVTVTGNDLEAVRVRAWEGADAFGTEARKENL